MYIIIETFKSAYKYLGFAPNKYSIKFQFIVGKYLINFILNSIAKALIILDERLIKNEIAMEKPVLFIKIAIQMLINIKKIKYGKYERKTINKNLKIFIANKVLFLN